MTREPTYAEYAATRKARTYWTLCERDTLTGRWSAQFGDYDRSVVAQERLDMHDSHAFPLLCNLKIVRSTDEQSSIDAAVRTLNAPGY